MPHICITKEWRERYHRAVVALRGREMGWASWGMALRSFREDEVDEVASGVQRSAQKRSKPTGATKS